MENPPDRPKDVLGPGILWKGAKMLLSAPKKSGKSSILQQLSMAMAGLCPMFGGLEIPERVKVMYVQFEMDEYIVYERQLASGILPKDYDQVYIATPRALKLDNQALFELFKKSLQEIRPDVLILDPLYNLHNLDENDAGEMQLVFDKLDELIKEFNLALILVHHHRKEYAGPGGDTSRPEDRARGTSKLQDWPDTLVTVERDDRNDRRILHFVCRRNPEMESITLKFNPDNWLYDTVPSYTREAIDQYVLNCLPMSKAELKESMGRDLALSDPQIETALKYLRDAGKVVSMVDRRTKRAMYHPGDGIPSGSFD